MFQEPIYQSRPTRANFIFAFKKFDGRAQKIRTPGTGRYFSPTIFRHSAPFNVALPPFVFRVASFCDPRCERKSALESRLSFYIKICISPENRDFFLKSFYIIVETWNDLTTVCYIDMKFILGSFNGITLRKISFRVNLRFFIFLKVIPSKPPRNELITFC